MAILSSLLPKRRGFTRLTCCGVTVMRVGKKRLPLVQRLAAKVSALLDIIGYVWIPAHSWASDLKGRASLGWAGGAPAPTCEFASLHPLQRALFPNPDVTDDQDHEENQNLNQPEHAERFGLHCPGKKENCLHVEDHKKNGDDVKPDRVASTSGIDRIDAAFVGHQLRLARIFGAHQLRREQGHRNQNTNQRDENKNGDVILRHLPSLRIKCNLQYYRRDSLASTRHSQFTFLVYQER